MSTSKRLSDKKKTSPRKTVRTTRAKEIRDSPRQIIDLERDADHRYWFRRHGAAERQEAIGVTRSLIESNIVDDTYFTDLARGRGRLAHVVAERILTNTLTAPIDAAILPQMVALRKWLDRYGPIVRNAEVMIVNPNRLLAGTLDIDVEIEHADAVVELKLSEPTPWHGLQLAAYAYLLDGPNWMRRQRFGLYLKPTGGYRFKEYDDVTDLDYFLRAHELLHWRIKHGTYDKPYGRRVGNGGTDSFIRGEIGDWRNGVDGGTTEF